MDKDPRQNLDEIVTTLSEAWKGSIITAGLNSGIFAALSTTTPTTVAQLAEKLNYDPDKVEKWAYYCSSMGLLNKSDGGYIISPKCSLFLPDSPYKDIVGFMRLNDFFMRAAIEAPNSFKKNSSLDKLTEGKITRDYQPKVSDNLSAEVINYFKQYSMASGDTLLDVGCGIGAFSRTVLRNIPGLKITGLDPNLFAIEWGRKENRQLGLTERIKLVVGDAVEDIKEFDDESQDWVMAINLFHFFPVQHRFRLVQNMIRIAKKGVFFTEVLAEKTKISFAADALMSLLWNDFTGFFREKEAEEMNKTIARMYPSMKINNHPILQNSSYFVAIIK